MRDLRKYSQQTIVRLIAGGVLLLFIIGDGLIYLIYGPASAITGLLCLGIVLAPLLLIFFSLWIMEWVVNRANRE